MILSRVHALLFGGIIVFLGAFSIPQSSSAALLYTDPASAVIYRGDTVTLSVRVDTDEGECINAIDGVIQFGPAIVLEDVSLGDSILSVWLQSPVIDNKNHTVTFAGGIPGGYCGRIAGDPRLSNVVVDLIFRSPGLSIGGGESASTAEIVFDESSRVLLNDGRGTDATLKTQGAIITLVDTPGRAIDDTWSTRVADDRTPPADFTITLTQDTQAFSGDHFIVFSTLDKQSGIDHYEVMEEPFEDFNLFKWGGADAPWLEAESPYVLKDQSLNSTIRVKAIDKAGNETIATLVPEPALRSLSTQRLLNSLAISAFVLIFGSLLVFGLWRWRKHHTASRVDESNEDTETNTNHE